METSSTETQENKNTPTFEPSNRNKTGRILGGLVIIGVGSLLFARQAGVYFPEWLFTFETFLIGLGFYIWARSAFHSTSGLLLMAFGGFLLIDNVIPDLYIGQFFWPMIIIIGGIWMMFTPGKHSWSNHRRHRAERWKNRRYSQMAGYTSGFENSSADATSESYLDTTAIFGAVKKNFFTKDFKGGQVVNFMGGTEINLSQAEIQQPVTLEISQVFGGTKLILPAHWQVRSEIVAVMGGVEDKRAIHPGVQEDPNRILILRGTTVFGGIDIKSY